MYDATHDAASHSEFAFLIAARVLLGNRIPHIISRNRKQKVIWKNVSGRFAIGSFEVGHATHTPRKTKKIKIVAPSGTVMA
jgi:hypothetical protein